LVGAAAAAVLPDLHMAEADGVMSSGEGDGKISSRGQAKLLDTLAEMKYRQEMQAIADEVEENQKQYKWAKK
jgi:hypothetical protein